MKKKYVSDVVTKEVVDTWSSNEVITIKAGTGVGKSHFVKSTLYDKAVEQDTKILFLIHRTNCVDQFQIELEFAGKTDVIKIKTYQSIEYQYKKGKSFDFSPYDYICADEFHYFLGDSGYNNFTDMSLNAILSQKDKTRIFMSATGDSMKEYINEQKRIKTKDYELPIKYDFIRTLTFFHTESTIEVMALEAIRDNKKTIFFMDSASDAFDLYMKVKEHAVFNCGKSDKHFKHVDKDKLTGILKNERFDELILITTTCMDAGVNLKDDELKHVVCAVRDTGTLIQCIGRKRIMKETDHIHLHIKSFTNRQLGGFETQLRDKKKMADYFLMCGEEEYIREFQRINDKYNMVYDVSVGVKSVNWLAYYKCETDIREVKQMISYGEYGYCKFLADKFGKVKDDGWMNYIVYDDEIKKLSLNEYLDSILGKKLFKDEQKELIAKIDVRVDGKQQRSYRKLNKGLYMLNLPYTIIKNIDKRRKLEDGRVNPNRDKTYWMVMESLG